MPDKKVVVTNFAAGPRGFHERVGTDGQSPVTLAPGESREVVLANPDNAVYQAWLASGELKEGLSQEEQQKVAQHAAAFTAGIAGQLPGIVQPHPVVQQNNQALTNQPGPLPPNAPITHPPLMPTVMPPSPAPPPPPPALVAHPAVQSIIEPNLAGAPPPKKG